MRNSGASACLTLLLLTACVPPAACDIAYQAVIAGSSRLSVERA